MPRHGLESANGMRTFGHPIRILDGRFYLKYPARTQMFSMLVM